MTVIQNITSHLSVKKAGIAGAGGLGSNVAAALVRSGIGHLVIADFDIVTKANLNRQFYFEDQVGRPKVEALRENLLRIDPKTEVTALNSRITPQNAGDLFGTCDVVVEAFDRAGEKQWFAEWMTRHYPDKPLIMGSGMAGFGNLESIHIQRSGNLYICGDQRETDEKQVPLLAPRVILVAMMQADLVLELLLHQRPVQNI
ncbi:MAG: sulfur carrier protein ThiS adenylyltransferase ThiF [Bacteroidales bacterium]|nr:sulfur carrier protein ThiS adenylyltransferase ThiF [Bacteroidales bacterium]MDD5315058.1 sulfur carrier protein ThiS adenylyltransferase ThiF [Bacteroidales bacterium]MDD5714219.1 sulfur carrier protein ThiS adenylyltransferase ThiF [Bacteroidales bacterium]